MSSIRRPERLAKLACERLRQAILDGTLASGALYSEPRLAEALAISRTPVREALLELARERLVEVVPQRGVRVRHVSVEEAREVFELRAAIEPHMVRRLAAEAAAADLTRLREHLRQQEQAASDIATFAALAQDFHLLVPQLLGLERTREILASFRGVLYLAGFAVPPTFEVAAAILAEHRAIVDHLASGNGDAAAAAMHGHIQRNAQRYPAHFPTSG